MRTDRFLTAALLGASLWTLPSPALRAAPVCLVDQAPVLVTNVAPDVILVDFGKVAFGNLRLSVPAGLTNALTVHFGEAQLNGRIHRQPPGTVRYAKTTVSPGTTGEKVVAPAPDKRNTQQNAANTPPAVLTPAAWGVVLPFRWVEIEGWSGPFTPDQIRRQAAFATTWDDDAAAFRCSDQMLNRIWELCRYSIKATTFAGVYVDGDRERIPYEADAYLNQLSHYATDHDFQMARDTFDWLMKHPTWPTEWAPHMVFMAHADWLHTGDTNWVGARFESLKTKLLLDRVRADGLVGSAAKHIKRDDIVDWPAGERDGYVFTPANTVVNAFYLSALRRMIELAGALQQKTDAAAFATRERAAYKAFQKTFFDERRGVYRDGEGTDHAALHANAFPLAFGLVPAENRAGVLRFVEQRGMACSVYVAQYLMEGLFQNEAGTKALELMMAPGDRSWRHMVESGTTISWEAWDQRYKPNQDWNHAWGAAPANLLPRFVLGAQPTAPGWRKVLIRPNPGTLAFAEGKIPTPRGPLQVSWQQGPEFRLKLHLPPGMQAALELPASDTSRGVTIGGRAAPAQREGRRWIVKELQAGEVEVQVR
jgi:hypothetical protein